MASPAPIRAPKAAPLQSGDWIRAAFARLAQDGIDAVRVEVLARDLHVSKGSFYWHFRDRDELAGAMLEQWDEDERAWLAAAVADEHSAAARWAELVAHLTDEAHSRARGSMRDWARRDPRAAERARGIERKRRGYIAEVFEDVGFTARAAEAWSEMGLLVCLGGWTGRVVIRIFVGRRSGGWGIFCRSWCWRRRLGRAGLGSFMYRRHLARCPRPTVFAGPAPLTSLLQALASGRRFLLSCERAIFCGFAAGRQGRAHRQECLCHWSQRHYRDRVKRAGTAKTVGTRTARRMPAPTRKRRRYEGRAAWRPTQCPRREWRPSWLPGRKANGNPAG